MKNNVPTDTDQLWKSLFTLLGITILLATGLFIYLPLQNDIQAYFNMPRYDKAKLQELADTRARQLKSEWDYVENGIHVKTGMIYDQNFKHIQSSCLSCHSSKLITQNRATREGWQQMIRWMQATQNLPDLGEKEGPILDYLAKHYAPEHTGRRPNLSLSETEWYVLELK